jgi:hypothetical protein
MKSPPGGNKANRSVREVQLIGEAAAASKMIELLEQSPLLQNTTQRAQTTRGSQPNTERFQIATELKPRQLPEPIDLIAPAPSATPATPAAPAASPAATPAGATAPASVSAPATSPPPAASKPTTADKADKVPPASSAKPAAPGGTGATMSTLPPSAKATS